jgi:hypothetical protein
VKYIYVLSSVQLAEIRTKSTKLWHQQQRDVEQVYFQYQHFFAVLLHGYNMKLYLLKRCKYTASFNLLDYSIYGLRCVAFPDVCDDCDQENSSMHVLFMCPSFVRVRERFLAAVGRPFSFGVLESKDRKVQSAICDVGRDIYFEIARLCDSLAPAPTTTTTATSLNAT